MYVFPGEHITKQKEGKNMYKIDCKEALAKNRGRYVTVRLLGSDGDELHTITTGNDLRGRFEKLFTGMHEYIGAKGQYVPVYDWKQTLGSCQYRLPRTYSGIRARLIREYESSLEEE